jgi:hypothetical protein
MSTEYDSDYERMMDTLRTEQVDFVIVGFRSDEKIINLWFDQEILDLKVIAGLMHTFAHEVMNVLDDIKDQAEKN